MGRSPGRLPIPAVPFEGLSTFIVAAERMEVAAPLIAALVLVIVLETLLVVHLVRDNNRLADTAARLDDALRVLQAREARSSHSSYMCGSDDE
jgi:hypothetical protein